MNASIPTCGFSSLAPRATKPGRGSPHTVYSIQQRTCMDGGAPHTPRRSEKAVDSSEEECGTREQHAKDESSDGSDMERAPASWERVVPRPVHKGTEHHGVKAGYGGRARKGNSKPGGYDETPTRRGPQKKGRQMERIRYVEDERRKGGSLEQMIEVGRVSVHRTEEGRRTGEGTAATPPHDPG